MRTRIIVIIAAAVMAVLCGSCSMDSDAIYFILENEQKLPPSTLGENASFFGVARLGSVYYAAGYSITQGAIGTGGAVTWTVVNPQGQTVVNRLSTLPQENARCVALAAYGTDLFGGFRTDAESLGLYRAAGADFTAAGGGTLVTDAAVDGHQIIKLIGSGGQLLIISAVPTGVSATPYNYCLTAYNGGYIPLVTAADAVTTMIEDATICAGTYYAVSGNTLMYGAGPLTSTSTLGSYTIAEGNTLNGIHASGTSILIASKNGGIYISGDSGASWSNVAADTQSSTTVSYLDIEGPLPGTNNYIIGSEGYGMYYMASPYTALTRSADTRMKTLDLYGSIIRGFIVDAPDNVVFAYTAGNGLWKGLISASAESGIDPASWGLQ